MPKNDYNKQMGQKKYNTIDLSNRHRTSADMGQLIPIYLTDVLPGDSFQLSNQIDLKFLPMVTPVMHEIEAEIMWFFDEDRNSWGEDFENYIWGKTNVAKPLIGIDLMPIGSVGHHLGIPHSIGDTMQKGYAVPFNTYFRTYDQHFRNPAFQNEQAETLVAGDNNGVLELKSAAPLLRRNWNKDPHTSALPQPQLGADVLIPLLNTGSTAIVEHIEGLNRAGKIRLQSNDNFTGSVRPLQQSANGDFENDFPVGLYYDPNETLGITAAELNSNAASMREFTRSEALLRWAERGMRGTMGSDRHTDYLAAFWMMKSQDLRLDRVHYIGTTVRTPVRIDEIRGTAEILDSADNLDTPQGNLAGYGRALSGSKTLRYTAPDYGWLLGILCVRPKSAYSQGVDRMFQRETRFDHYWSDLATIGETAVKTKEVLCGPNNSANESDFGYHYQYYEYFYKKDQYSGQMDDSNRLTQWHLGRQFDPNSFLFLNSDFVTCIPSKRIFADTTAANDTMVIQVVNSVKARRQVAKLRLPSL